MSAEDFKHVLKTKMEDAGWDYKELSIQAGSADPEFISRISNGTPSDGDCLRLGKAFTTTWEFWKNLSTL